MFKILSNIFEQTVQYYRKTIQLFFKGQSNHHDMAFTAILTIHVRTSDGLNEGLPIKMTREKFQQK